ncbi:hypothetical protein [Roseofilum capinflatum]|uniref:CARD domain-containing protein n=1 Tax=Roseofilum capinflatum BLCC-M114 TaxID=3022440 RepID=A0ABT7B8T6_9CYAN|nr:hypothetical protein [Roseofilum capinflatum]MDJ1174698.1 hypothetical protein [Roseofilum capinflatum BLCC-M114]
MEIYIYEEDGQRYCCWDDHSDAYDRLKPERKFALKSLVLKREELLERRDAIYKHQNSDEALIKEIQRELIEVDMKQAQEMYELALENHGERSAHNYLAINGSEDLLKEILKRIGA